jgi:hypothetical protein
MRLVTFNCIKEVVVLLSGLIIYITPIGTTLKRKPLSYSKRSLEYQARWKNQKRAHIYFKLNLYENILPDL